MSLEPALRTRIETLLRNDRIVLFMKGEPRAPQCGFSAKAIGALESLGVDYAHINVLEDAEIREGIKAYGDWPTIPQLYVDGELVGGSDIVEQMVNSGELHAALGVAAPDRTPPAITITDAAAEMLRGAIADAGAGYALQVDIDAGFDAKLNLAPIDVRAITSESAGIRVQFGAASAQRARGLTIGWVDTVRGRGLVIDNPNAPAKVKSIDAAEAARLRDANEVTLVDVRPADERATASVAGAFVALDDESARLESMDKDTPFAFLCHHGSRSAAVAEQFRQLGFTRLYNVEGGIDAWSEHVDAGVARY